MDYLWDTSVLLHFLRQSSTFEKLDQKHKFFASGNFTTVTFVSMGEIMSLSLQFKWGQLKIERMEQALLKLPVMSIERREILEAYAEIDTYSQAKHPSKSLPSGKTARKMGKNDIWIAATAHVAGPTFHLVTSDHDFDHLNGTFINLIKF